jgi:uncharacterized membrane protein YfhO
VSLLRLVYLAAIAALAVCLVIALVRTGISKELTQRSSSPSGHEVLTLLVALVLGILFVYGAFLFGSSRFAYRDVGSDTVEQYVPFYLNMIDSIREGTFGAWNFQYGLGNSFMSYQSWAFDPFNLILVPLGLLFGDSSLSLILVFVQSIKIVLCGLLFDLLLKRHCQIPLARVFGSLIYAFCGFLSLWGQHYWLGTTFVLSTLMLVLIESSLERRSTPRFLGICVCTAISLIMSAYVGFMVLLFCAVYAILRSAYLSSLDSSTSFLKTFLPLAAPVICGILLSCLVLVPYASLLLGESSRLSGGGSPSLGSLLEFVPLKWLPAIASRLLGNSLISSGQDIPESIIPATSQFAYVNVYEFIQLGFSAGALILLSQFYHWLLTDADRRAKALALVATGLIVLYCVNYFLPSLSNLFVAPKYRSSFCIAAPVCIAMSIGLEKRLLAGKTAIAPLLLASALTVLAVVWSLANTVNGSWECFFYLAVVLIVTALFVLPKTGTGKAIAIITACALIVSSSIVDDYMTTNRRTTCTAADFPDATQPNHASDTEAALEYIRSQDDSFYRVEKTYSDWCRLEDSLIENYPGVSSYNSTLDSDVADFYRALWPEALNGDSTYQSFVNAPDQPEIATLLDVKYVLSREPLTYSWCELLTKVDDIYIYRSKNQPSLATISSSVVTESESDSLPSTEDRRALLTDSIIVPDGVADDLPLSDEDVSSSSEFTLSGCSDIDGQVSTSGDSVVCLSIPYTSGWTVCVDGVQVETFRADYGFTGFVMASGTHEIKACYSPVGIMPGALLCGAGVVLTILGCLLTKRAERSSDDAARPKSYVNR